MSRWQGAAAQGAVCKLILASADIYVFLLIVSLGGSWVYVKQGAGEMSAVGGERERERESCYRVNVCLLFPRKQITGAIE